MEPWSAGDILAHLRACSAGTFTGTSARQHNQTVSSYAERIVNHEQPHLDQIESLLR